MRRTLAIALASALTWTAVPAWSQDGAAKAIYESACIACHASGQIPA